MRDHKGPETTTLVVFDDHEVDNNWADETPEKAEQGFPSGRVGRLATFLMLDTRQYRDDQSCGDGYRTDCPEAVDPQRSVMGQRQEEWLIDGFSESRARWDILGQQGELVCSSITTGGDGADSASGTHPWLGWNSHLKFQNNLRGYVNTTITPEQMNADFRCLPQVSVRGADVFTRASFAIVDREPGLYQTRDHPPVSALRKADGPRTPDHRDTVDWETSRP